MVAKFECTCKSEVCAHITAFGDCKLNDNRQQPFELARVVSISLKVTFLYFCIKVVGGVGESLLHFSFFATKTTMGLTEVLSALFTFESTDFTLTSIVTNVAFYCMIVICTLQTLYPIYMVINMWLRQLSIFYRYFHEVRKS